MSAYEVAYCLEADGKLQTRTVFPHERGVKVNALTLMGVPLFKESSDEDIDRIWRKVGEPKGVTIRKVLVIRFEDVDLEPGE